MDEDRRAAAPARGPLKWRSPLTFKEASGAAQTFPRLRCHLAFAVASGFDRPSCPLFIKGTTLRQEGADGITFSGDSPEVARALRSEARRIFPASKTAAISPR